MTFPQFDMPCFVDADRTRVKQVLINLLSNAIKYNREQGTVEVTCAVEQPGAHSHQRQGYRRGIASGKAGAAFQPFNRLGQESSGEEGTGIGLVVTKRLVELMGGVIGVESTRRAWAACSGSSCISAPAPQPAAAERRSRRRRSRRKCRPARRCAPCSMSRTTRPT